MPYLIFKDYLNMIQAGNLAAISTNSPQIRQQAEQQAQAEAVSMLKSKYITSDEFTNTGAWQASGPPTGTYQGRKPLTATAWAASTTYAIGAQILYTDNNIYQCITANNDAVFDPTKWLNLGANGSIPYYANDRVFISPANVYSATSNYALGVQVMYNYPWATATNYTYGQQILYTDGNIYNCIVPNSDVVFNLANWALVGPQQFNGSVWINTTAITGGGESWNPAHWALLGTVNQIFYAPTPYCNFDFTKGVYNVGDVVFWNNRIYVCLMATRFDSHEFMLQRHLVQNKFYGNVYPDDKVNGLQAWGSGVPYVIPAGTLITNQTYWTLGDNRDAQMVQKLVDITLYHLHSLISPNNIPVLRIKRYIGEKEDRSIDVKGHVVYPVYSALGWLQDCVRGGDSEPNLPKIDPPKGERVMFAGNVRNENSYVLFAIFGLWKIIAMLTGMSMLTQGKFFT